MTHFDRLFYKLLLRTVRYYIYTQYAGEIIRIIRQYVKYVILVNERCMTDTWTYKPSNSDLQAFKVRVTRLQSQGFKASNSSPSVFRHRMVIHFLTFPYVILFISHLHNVLETLPSVGSFVLGLGASGDVECAIVYRCPTPHSIWFLDI